MEAAQAGFLFTLKHEPSYICKAVICKEECLILHQNLGNRYFGKVSKELSLAETHIHPSSIHLKISFL